MHATRIARKRGAEEAVYVDRDGTVLEAPTSSVFWVGADGTLRTPALETGILDSITRRVVVEAVACEQGAFAAAQIRAAQSAFLASTTREIQPITSIDGAELPDPERRRGRGRGRGGARAAVERGARPGLPGPIDWLDGPRAERRAAADLRDRPATSPTTSSRPASASTTAPSASTSSSPASSARSATSGRRSPRPMAAAASTTSATR